MGERDIGRLPRLDAEADAHEIGPHLVERGGFGVDGDPAAGVRLVDPAPETCGVADPFVVRRVDLRERRDVRLLGVGGESTNLVGGTCRVGDDPATSVLDPDCRAWTSDNLYVTDGSFLPTGGNVPFTVTLYANAFRVATRIRERLE